MPGCGEHEADDNSFLSPTAINVEQVSEVEKEEGAMSCRVLSLK